jgi:hypothetical protein
MRKLLLFFIIPLHIISCSFNRYTYNTAGDAVVAFSKENFNGNYSNRKIKHDDGVMLWDILIDNHNFKKNHKAYEATSILELEFDGKNKLNINVKSNDSIIDHIELRCKVYKDMLSVRKRIRLIPFPFVLFRYRARKVFIGNTTKNALVLKYGKSEFLWILIMAGGYHSFDSAMFDKLND